MAEFRIYDLTNEPTPEDDYVFIADRSDLAEAVKVTREAILQDEVTARTAADTAIKNGAGLETGGNFLPDPAANYTANADFTAAGYNLTLKNAIRLLDTALNDLTGQQEIQVQISLTSAEILASGTAITKIIAPGAGFYISLCDYVDAKNTYGTVAYASAGANGLYLRFVGASDYCSHLDQAFLQSASTIRTKFLIAKHDLPLNTGLEIIAPDGNPTNGDGTIDIILRYVINADFTTGTSIPTGCCVYPLAATFVNGDLDGAGNLVINHNLNTEDVLLIIMDNNKQNVVVNWANGNAAGADTYNYVTAPIGAGIPGTWSYMIFAIPQ